MFNGPSIVSNQLLKSIWKVSHLENSSTYILGGGEISIQQKMTKIGTFENKVQILSFKTP
jgi:hypothetical protein